ncbi:hypothetical protein [Paucilactobacillus sp. N302-9]
MRTVRSHNVWDENKISQLTNLIIMDSYTNECLNVNELAEHFGISVVTMKRRIYELRKIGALPKFDLSNQEHKFGRPYSKWEINTVIHLSKSGYGNKEIGRRISRTAKSVEAVKTRLIRQGKTISYSQRWSKCEDDFLLKNIELDINNICTNTQYLARTISRPKSGVEKRIFRLRQKGKLPLPTRRGASDPGVERWLKFRKDWIKQTFKRW